MGDMFILSYTCRGRVVGDKDADSRERARFALIGNAVTVQVSGRSMAQFATCLCNTAEHSVCSCTATWEVACTYMCCPVLTQVLTVLGPQVGRWIGERLMNTYHHKYVPPHTEKPMPKEYESRVHVPR
jgi:hypothetical protein